MEKDKKVKFDKEVKLWRENQERAKERFDSLLIELNYELKRSHSIVRIIKNKHTDLSFTITYGVNTDPYINTKYYNKGEGYIYINKKFYKMVEKFFQKAYKDLSSRIELEMNNTGQTCWITLPF